MNKTVHITFGDSGYGLLKHFFSLNNSDNEMLENSVIINLNEDYSLGPLADISTESGLKSRLEWFDKSFMGECHDEFEEDIKCSDRISASYKSLLAIEKSDEIVVWHGENTSDQIGLKYLINRFRENNIYEVAISSVFKIKEISDYCPISLAECDYSMVEEALKHQSLLSDSKKKKLIEEWNIVESDKSKLRVIFDGVIESVEEDYYDKMILSNCSFNYKSAALVIGSTMGRSNQLVCDSYIHCRVINLINSGKIIFRGEKSNLRSLEIKLDDSLKNVLESIFGENKEVDEDGRYHYLLENKDSGLIIETTHISKWTDESLANKMIIDYNDENFFSLNLRINGNVVFFINNILVSNARVEKIESEDIKNGVSKKILEKSIFIENENNEQENIIIKLSPYFTVGII